MLSTKNNETLNRMREISTDSKTISAVENQYLSSALRSIQAGTDFALTVRKMNLRLLKLESHGIELTGNIKRLSNDLIKKYGDPNLVYRGFGRTSGWARIDDALVGKGPLSETLGFLVELSVTFLFMKLIFYNPFLSDIKRQFGQGGYIIFNIIVVVSYLIWLGITGSLKKPSK